MAKIDKPDKVKSKDDLDKYVKNVIKEEADRDRFEQKGKGGPK